MHKVNIDTLRDEAKRQLQLLKELLQKAWQKGLVEEPAKNEQNRATFDTESLPKVLEILDGESHKLEHLDMVLAVVGTMKAGKSTSINAIVGAEVLPNRNRPMTALPTLIRHSPGVLQPTLVFEKVGPLNESLAKLAQIIKNKSANSEILAELQCDADMAELLTLIAQQKPFASRHEGEEKIFHFLKSLNDLVRLCSALDVEFPFAAYAKVDAMPVIEVEFSHLKNMSATQGRLSLLDTPGPNESGQQHLRHMLKDQLKKASAVLAVLDYTQLKSDADAQVREYLIEISDTTKGRMYTLVNKFDQKDRNSDDEATVKQYVAQTLMKDTIARDSVFPVSSLRGYLASRARNEIQRHGNLPAHDEPWVKDFGSIALGELWDTEAAVDTALVQRAADGLWKKSGFAPPLEQVIGEAHRNAALEALRSATSKLDRIARDTGDFFKANVGAFKKSVANLQKNIDDLSQDIENINQVEEVTGKALKDSLKGMQDKVENAAKEVRKNIQDTLRAYFKEGKRIEADNQSRKPIEQKPRRKKEATKLPFGLEKILTPGNRLKKAESEDASQDFDPNSPIIKFDDKSEANDFRNKIEISVRNVMYKAESSIKSCIQDSIDNFSTEVAQLCASSLEKIKKSVQKNLDGFNIEIHLPNARSISLDTSVSNILEDAIEDKTRRVTKHRRKSGVWGTICGWFNTSDWGWESYEVNEEYYQVDINRIGASSNEGVKTLFDSADTALSSEIYPQLQHGVDEFFGAFREKVEHVRGDLMTGIKRHELDQNQKAAILEDSKQMAGEASDLGKDCAALNDSAEMLRREEGISLALEERPA